MLFDPATLFFSRPPEDSILCVTAHAQAFEDTLVIQVPAGVVGDAAGHRNQEYVFQIRLFAPSLAPKVSIVEWLVEVGFMGFSYNWSNLLIILCPSICMCLLCIVLVRGCLKRHKDAQLELDHIPDAFHDEKDSNAKKTYWSDNSKLGVSDFKIAGFDTELAALVPSSSNASEASMRGSKEDVIARMRSNTDVWEVHKDELRLEGMIGKGTYKMVFRARYKEGGWDGTDDPDPGELVAVSVIQCEVQPHHSENLRQQIVMGAVQDFEHEAQIMASLNGHPNIICLLGCCYETLDPAEIRNLSMVQPTEMVGEASNSHMLSIGLSFVTELCPYGSLYEYMYVSGQRLDEGTKKGIAYGVASGLEHCHTSRLIHRDLKPHNILLGEGFIPKLCDFGTAKQRKYTSATTRHKGEGTVGYMAPEQFPHHLVRGSAEQITTQEQSKVTEKSDVWAFGCFLMELFLEVSPWVAVDPRTVEHQDDDSWIPPEVKEFIVQEDYDHSARMLSMECVSYDPLDRPSANQIRAHLEELGWMPESMQWEGEEAGGTTACDREEFRINGNDPSDVDEAEFEPPPPLQAQYPDRQFAPSPPKRTRATPPVPPATSGRRVPSKPPPRPPPPAPVLIHPPSPPLPPQPNFPPSSDDDTSDIRIHLVEEPEWKYQYKDTGERVSSTGEASRYYQGWGHEGSTEDVDLDDASFPPIFANGKRSHIYDHPPPLGPNAGRNSPYDSDNLGTLTVKYTRDDSGRIRYS